MANHVCISFKLEAHLLLLTEDRHGRYKRMQSSLRGIWGLRLQLPTSDVGNFSVLGNKVRSGA